MIEFSRYDVDTGRIIARGRCPVQMVEWQQEDGTGLLIGAHNSALVMVVNGLVVPRPESPITWDRLDIVASGADAVEFAGVPAGTEVTIAAAGAQPDTFTIDDGALHFDVDYPGVYTLTFVCWPYRDLRVVVNAS